MKTITLDQRHGKNSPSYVNTKGVIVISMIALVLTLGITGCHREHVYEEGTKVTQEQLSQFIKGKTTKDIITSSLGGPQDIKLGGGKQIYIYKYQKICSLAANEHCNTTFIFDDKGVLEDILTTTSGSVKNPFTNR